MARRRANTTKLEIIQVATQMFMERGFTETSAKAVSDKLDISTGNLTFHFPTKEQKWYSEPTYPIGKRIAGALDTIMMIFQVPEEIRQSKIKKVLAMDYRGMGRRISQEFKEYIKEVNEQALEGLR